jgi:pantoate--beta-alanine ligase
LQILRSVADFVAWRARAAGAIGLVPTMGYLHEGHLSLVRASRERDDATVVSIFVNPTQFGPHEDLARYPRDEARDLGLLEPLGVAAVLAPPAAEMYPQGCATFVDVEGITARLEGASRPGHFRGVATIVAKLLILARPQRAYFGQKDAQQLAVIRRLVRDLHLPVDVIAMPIVREADGLALSSRNAYLSTEERRAATVLHRALDRARAMAAAGERHASIVRDAMHTILAAEPLAAIDYVSVADSDTFDELAEVRPGALALVAARIGTTRLIDNMPLAPRPALAYGLDKGD